MLNPTKISKPGGRAGTPRASCDRTRREQESQEDKEARLDRQRLPTNHLTPRLRWVHQLVINKTSNSKKWLVVVIGFQEPKQISEMTKKFV